MDWMDGLMDRASDLLPEVVGLNLDSGEKLEQGTEPPTAPRAPQYWMPTALCVCVHLDGLNAEHKFHCWLCICSWVTEAKIEILGEH